MRRVPEFDALRALAALAVMLFHLRPDGNLTYFGMSGVHLFLVLSGFLITQIVIGHVGTPGFFRAFYARRLLRIWPVYYVTLVALVLFQRTFQDPPSLQGLPYYLTFTQHLWEWPGLNKVLTAPPVPILAFDHSWTVAIEEQFYLFWPLAIALMGPKRIAPMVAAILAFGLWFKTLYFHSWILLNVFGAFALGALAATMLADRERVERHRIKLSAFFITCTVAGWAYVWWYFNVQVPNLPRIYWPWRDSLQNFAFYLLHFGIVGFVATNAGRWFLAPLRLKELTFLGEISYGMYMYHLPIYWIAGGYASHPDQPIWPYWVAQIGASIAVAAVSYRYFEAPILTLKKYFPYARREEVAAPVHPRPSAVRQPRMIYARAASGAEKADATS
jgi:peptidoglycan/LPS O-acetylase OafA/YrhL